MSNFRLIICLPLIWKLLTGILAEELYESREKTNLLPWKQKEFRRGSRGTKDQLIIGRVIVKVSSSTSLAVAWNDYRKTYDMISHI